jgi:hypothetical protein
MSQPDETRAANLNPYQRGAGWRGGRFHFLYSAILALLCLALATRLRADTISGTVKDPSGAVVAGARIEITGGNLTQAIVLTSDESGKFVAPNLNPGNYSVKAAKDGFDELVTAVELKGTAELALSLTIAAQKTTVNVSEKNSAFANSDALYRELRDLGLGQTYRVENFTLTMDAGTFQFKSGTITFLALVDRLETGAIFVGEGHFTLQPTDDINKREMLRRSGAPNAEEEFNEAVFRFTGNQYVRFTTALGARTETPPEAAAAFARWKEKVRHRHEIPEGFTQAILQNETIDNVDADVLAAIYLHARLSTQGPPLFHSPARGRHSTTGFSRGSGADQLQWRGNGRRRVVLLTPASRAEGAHGEFAGGQAAIRHAPLQH